MARCELSDRMESIQSPMKVKRTAVKGLDPEVTAPANTIVTSHMALLKFKRIKRK